MSSSDPAQTVEDAVREALGLGPEARLDPRHRNLMRQRLLSVAPKAPRVSDRVFGAFGLLSLPGPWLVRGLGVVAVLAGLMGGVVVASADTLPDHPLYAAKVAVEQLRLAIAVTSQDRAAVEISIADVRLQEAERLAQTAGASETLQAAGAYAAHVASAAAALAEIDSPEPERAALVAQVEAKVDEHRERVAAITVRLAADPKTAPAAAALRPIAVTPQATHANVPARIAETAAAVGKQVAAVAVQAEERAKAEREKNDKRPAADNKGPSPRQTTEKTKESANQAEKSRERAREAAKNQNESKKNNKRKP